VNNDPKSTDDKPMPLEGIRIVEFGIFIAGPEPVPFSETWCRCMKIESWTGIRDVTCPG
jgi:hypothetical protein